MKTAFGLVFVMITMMNSAFAGCTDDQWCAKMIVDESSAFIMCSLFIMGNKLNDQDQSGNKCKYRCAKFGYNSAGNDDCECTDCVSNFDVMPNVTVMSELYHKSCWDIHYVNLTVKSNNFCNNHPNQTVFTKDITEKRQTNDARHLVNACRKLCVDHEECIHLIVDREEWQCLGYKSCRVKKIPREWDSGRYDHYFLMCPDRGGCDWRYRTAALYDESDPEQLVMTMRITNAPWAPFFSVNKTETVWAEHEDQKACTITNTDKFANKIVLFEGTSPMEAGPTLPELKFETKPGHFVPPPDNFCEMADQIFVAQKHNALAAFIVLKKRFTISIFDEMSAEHLRYYGTKPEDTPNIPTGVIIHEYWNGFKDNKDGQMAVGCASQFGLSQCVPVNFPNIDPGYIFCGCVLPREIKRYNDASQTITMEPCWQMDVNDPRYCVLDTIHCKDYQLHMKKIGNTCDPWCDLNNVPDPNQQLPVPKGGKNKRINVCKLAKCKGCAKCNKKTWIDKAKKGSNDIINTIWLRYRGMQPVSASSTFTPTGSEICNNILEKYKLKLPSKNKVKKRGQDCRNKCSRNAQCMYYSVGEADYDCILHASCDLFMMATEPADWGWSIQKLKRTYQTCFKSDDCKDPKHQCKDNTCEWHEWSVFDLSPNCNVTESGVASVDWQDNDVLGLWSREGRCWATKQETMTNLTQYEAEVDVWVGSQCKPNAEGPKCEGGFAFNIIDPENYDYVYFRSHADRSVAATCIQLMSIVDGQEVDLDQTNCFQGNHAIPQEQLFSMKINVPANRSVTFYMKYNANQKNWVKEWVYDFTNHEIIGKVGVLRAGNSPPTSNKEVYFTNMNVRAYSEDCRTKIHKKWLDEECVTKCETDGNTCHKDCNKLCVDCVCNGPSRRNLEVEMDESSFINYKEEDKSNLVDVEY